MEIIKTTPATVTHKGTQYKGVLRLFQVENPWLDHYNPLHGGTPDEVNLYNGHYHRNLHEYADDHILAGILGAIGRKCKTSLDYTKKWYKFVVENFGDDWEVTLGYDWQNNNQTLLCNITEEDIDWVKLQDSGFDFNFQNRFDQDGFAKIILQGFDHGFEMVHLDYSSHGCMDGVDVRKNCDRSYQVLLWEIDPETVTPEVRAEKVEEILQYGKILADWLSSRIKIIEADFIAVDGPLTLKLPLTEDACDLGYDRDIDLWEYDKENHETHIENFNQQMIGLLVEKYEAIIG